MPDSAGMSLVMQLLSGSFKVYIMINEEVMYGPRYDEIARIKLIHGKAKLSSEGSLHAIQSSRMLRLHWCLLAIITEERARNIAEMFEYRVNIFPRSSRACSDFLYAVENANSKFRVCGSTQK